MCNTTVHTHNKSTRFEAESVIAIECTGTDNQIRNNQKKIQKKTESKHRSKQTDSIEAIRIIRPGRNLLGNVDFFRN